MTQHTVRRHSESYGHDIGILMLDCRTPFVPGDVGNASTYDFPVLYRTMPDVTLDRLINQGDMSMLEPVVEHARWLERQGVIAITSDCGYMLHFQSLIAAQISIPIMLSSLLQLPFIASTMGKRQAVGVICANRKRLTAELLRPLLSQVTCPVHIAGLEDQPNFRGPILDETPLLDTEAIEREVVGTVIDLQARHPDIGAWLLECSNLPPYAAAIQAATGKPVFDFITMINYMRLAGRRQPYKGNY